MEGRSALSQYIRDIADLPLLCVDEEHSLGLKAQTGDEEAINTLVEHNLKLVVSVAKTFGTPQKTLDMVAEGNLGLIRAAQKYDPTIGRFPTYARWWIEQYIRNFVNCTSVVRLPHQRDVQLKALYTLKHKYMSQLDREPTASEIKQHLNISDKVLRTLELTHKPSDISSDHDDFVESCIAVTKPNQLRSRKAELLIELERFLIHDLDEIETRVLRRRFGIKTEKVTLEELCTRLGRSNYGIRLIQERALQKLRTHFIYKQDLTLCEIAELFGD